MRPARAGPDELAGERGLAHPGAPVRPIVEARPVCAKMPAESASRSARAVLDHGDGPGDGAAVARKHALDQLRDVHRPKPNGRGDPRRRTAHRGSAGAAPGIARSASRSDRQYSRWSISAGSSPVGDLRADHREVHLLALQPAEQRRRRGPRARPHRRATAARRRAWLLEDRELVGRDARAADSSARAPWSQRRSRRRARTTASTRTRGAEALSPRSRRGSAGSPPRSTAAAGTGPAAASSTGNARATAAADKPARTTSRLPSG